MCSNTLPSSASTMKVIITPGLLQQDPTCSLEVRMGVSSESGAR